MINIGRLFPELANPTKQSVMCTAKAYLRLATELAFIFLVVYLLKSVNIPAFIAETNTSF